MTQNYRVCVSKKESVIFHCDGLYVQIASCLIMGNFFYCLDSKVITENSVGRRKENEEKEEVIGFIAGYMRSRSVLIQHQHIRKW